MRARATLNSAPNPVAALRCRAGRFFDRAEQSTVCGAQSLAWLRVLLAQTTEPEFVRYHAANVTHFYHRAARLRHAGERIAAAGRELAARSAGGAR